MKNLANNYKLFWGLIGKNKKKVFILLGCIQVIAILEIVGISLFMPFLNGTLETSENSFDTRKYISFLLDLFSPKYQTLAIGFIIITIFLLKNILKIWYARYSVQFSLSYYVDWSTLTLQKYMFAPMSIVSNSKEGVLINDVTREPTNATKCIETIILMVSSLFVLFYLYIFLIMINTIVTLVISVFGIIIYYLFKVLIFTKTENFGKFKLKQNQKISAIAAESITAIKQIKLFSGEQLVQDNFFSKISYLSKKIIKHRIFIALPELFRELPLILFCVGAIVFISLIDESNFSEILPILAVVFIIGVRLFSLITQIIKNRMLVISLIPSLKLVNKNVTENTQKEELFKGKKIKNIERDIEIQDVAFKYNDSNQILNNLNLLIPRNKISAIVVPSGVGKT